MLSSVSINTVAEIRPSDIEHLKRAGLLTVGAVACVPHGELSKRLGISADAAAEIVSACDSLCHQGEIKVQSLAEMCSKFSRVARPRKTMCQPIDSILDGGFRHGSVSEIYGLPGLGKTQLAMQLAAVATMPAFFGGVHAKAPILVIDTEGSWTVERVTQFCGEFGSLMKKSYERQKQRKLLLVNNKQDADDAELNKKNKQQEHEDEHEEQDDEDDEIEKEIRDFKPTTAVNRIQFVRASDVSTVAAALYIYRENCARASVAVAMERRERRSMLSLQVDDDGDDDDASAQLRKRAARTTAAPDEEDDADDDGDDDDVNFCGGLLIIDSIAALFKESRIGDDLGGDLQLGGGSNKNSAAMTRNQSIAAVSRLLSGVAEDTQSAVIVTNQMIRRWVAADNANNNNSSSSNSTNVPRYVPALSDAWSSVPLCRVEVKRIHNVPFTTQLRRCVVVRHWDWTSQLEYGAGDDEEEEEETQRRGAFASSSVAPLGIAPGSDLLLPRRETIFRIGAVLTMPSVDDGDDNNNGANSNVSSPQQHVSSDGNVYTFAQPQQHQQRFSVKQEPVRRERPTNDDDDGKKVISVGASMSSMNSVASLAAGSGIHLAAQHNITQQQQQQQQIVPAKPMQLPQMNNSNNPSTTSLTSCVVMPKTPLTTPTISAPGTASSSTSSVVTNNTKPKRTLFKVHLEQQQQQVQVQNTRSNSNSPQQASLGMPPVPPSFSGGDAAAAAAQKQQSVAAVGVKKQDSVEDEAELIPVRNNNQQQQQQQKKKHAVVDDDDDELIFATARSRTQKPKSNVLRPH